MDFNLKTNLDLEQTILEQVDFLKGKQKSFLRKKKLYQPLKSIIGFLKLITALVSIAAAFLVVFMPPVGIILIIIGVGLWILINYLEKIPNPIYIYEDTVLYKALPEVLKKLNASYQIKDNYSPVNLQNAKIIDQNTLNKTSRSIAKPHIEGDLKNVHLEISIVDILAKKVNYAKSSVGCLTRIILLPVTILEAFDTDNSSTSNTKREAYLYKEEEKIAHVFFAQAYFKISPIGELYSIPKDYNNKQFSANPNLDCIKIENAWINQNYNFYVSKQELEVKILIPSIVKFLQWFYEDEQVHASISFINNVLNISIPMKQDLLNTNLNHAIDREVYFKNLIQYTYSFEQVVEAINTQIATP